MPDTPPTEQWESPTTTGDGANPPSLVPPDRGPGSQPPAHPLHHQGRAVIVAHRLVLVLMQMVKHPVRPGGMAWSWACPRRYRLLGSQEPQPPAQSNHQGRASVWARRLGNGVVRMVKQPVQLREMAWSWACLQRYSQLGGRGPQSLTQAHHQFRAVVGVQQLGHGRQKSLWTLRPPPWRRLWPGAGLGRGWVMLQPV